MYRTCHCTCTMRVMSVLTKIEQEVSLVECLYVRVLQSTATKSTYLFIYLKLSHL